MSLVYQLNLPSLDAKALTGLSIEELRIRFPLPAQLTSIRNDYDLNHGYPLYKFDGHYSVGDGLTTYTLDPACAGKLWEMAIKIADYVCRASLSNRIPAEFAVTCGISAAAYEELGIPPPSILDPRATGRANLFAMPLPLHEAKEVLRCEPL
jgi:hypothetical protein